MSSSTLALGVAAVALLLSPTAAAGAGEHALSLHGGWVRGLSHGGGAGLGWWYGFDDFWNLRVDAGWAFLTEEPTEALHVLDLGAAVQYHIDAFQWIPSFHIGLAGLLALDTAGAEPRWGFGLGVGGALDYRPARRWGVGVLADWKGPLVGDANSRFFAGLRVNLYLY